MSEREFSDQEVSDDEVFHPISSFKNVYIGRQSLTVNSSRRQQIINIQKCLMNQVDSKMDQLDTQFPDSFFRPTQINATNFAKIDEIMTLPFFNHEYINFMPEELENQFNFRFNRYSTPYFEPQWSVHENMNIIVYQYKSTESCMCMPGYNQMLFYIPKKDSIASIFKKHKVDTKIRGLCLKSPQNDMNVVLLHDFFQNPFSLIPIINYLHKQEYNVFVPYIADLVQTVKGQQTDAMIQNMTKHLYNFVKLAVGLNSQYQVVCQGTSTILGLNLQHEDLCCLKAIVMNPIMRFRVRKNLAKNPVTIQVKQTIPVSDFQSASVISTSHSSQRDPDAKESDKENSEIAAPKRQPNNIQISFKQKPKPTRRKDREELVEIGLPSSQIQELPLIPKSVRLTQQKFQFCDQLTVQQNGIPAPHINEIFNMKGNENTYYMVNDCLRAVYYDLEILQTILNILGIKKLKDIKMVQNITEFIKIYQDYTFESSMRNAMFSSLQSLYVFAPLEAFVGYNIYKETFDSYFFEMLSEMDYYILPQSYDFDGPQNVMFLVGSNSSMVTKQQMHDILQVTENYLTIEARSVLGAGQDMFFTGAILIEKILKANG
ncbi:Conserved_hypothetical protein [Hexamita inflata]|uniref:Uncharacterized protein n=1 Tax=Hexamita inflata TaxID=28002 RepID=A0AA86UPE5_9EUKA|nr:Conserved hypothetical protein [Hexamita inflata]CAI9966460.1 Conserved hypothetical protein [Hexamita inflata]